MLTFPANQQQTEKTISSKISDKLADVSVSKTGQSGVFEITTTRINTDVVANVLKELFAGVEISQPKVQETINNAILKAFGDDLTILQNLEPKITSADRITEKIIETEPQFVDFLGGIKITCSLGRPATAEEINRRFQDIRFKPDTRDLPMYSSKFFAPDLTNMPANKPLNGFVYVSLNEGLAAGQPDETEWKNYEETEKTKIMVSMQLSESLPRVTQISPSVGAEAKTRALLAIILSLLALLAYIWFRFGNLRYGIGAVITLFHDTCVTVGLISACTYIAQTHIGQALLIGDFKFNLAIVAAILTLIGYSLNDTIVVYDRIRENRRKGTLTSRLISDSINDTLSRTLLTGTTTLVMVWIMFIFGGEGLRGFNFVMGTGILIGTYSSIAISAPVLLFRVKSKAEGKKLTTTPTN
jgi:SecD/SecF fusion protein